MPGWAPGLSWAPGGPSGGRLGRQEARREAVWAARSPEPSVLPTVAANMQVLRRLQAGRRPQAGGRRLPKYKAAEGSPQNFYMDTGVPPPD